MAEQAERYDEMVELMDKVVEMVEGGELDVEERTLLSVAYKNAVGSRRASWRIISSIEHKEVKGGNEDQIGVAKQYKENIEVEITKICDSILKLLESNLIPSATTVESKVFYLKMKADYLRYLAEIKKGTERKEAAEITLSAYKSAEVYSRLAPTHPIRLGLALNISVFYYEILNLPEDACDIGKEAFEAAVPAMDTLGEESYKDSTLIMQLLKDNLTLWASDIMTERGENVRGVSRVRWHEEIETATGQDSPAGGRYGIQAITPRETWKLLQNW
ncbi:unnamed protein product [Spirodela intermedia]|uniref:14-3-3 domain-containing protein n=1 Tax=Spirodela intermedia TaxID=51605 RepID=A0A7I8JQV1_SPIIN|nr:unnamed protein product [Spirodela intermedia]CAA6672520.1 unnamed protein product [Spirodela intermedia]